MRTILLLTLLATLSQPLAAQFSTDKLELSFGYNAHNTYAKRYNHLINAYNDAHYPLLTRKNLGNLHWLTGITAGANYHITEDIRLQGVFKTRRQFMETSYVGRAEYRQYMFRQHTLELGASMLLSDEEWFSHYAGAGVVFGVLGTFSDWTTEQGYRGSKKMIDIDHTAVVGLSLSYEAHLRLHKHLRLFLRPVAQFSLNSHSRKLTDFFDPIVTEDGVYYGEGEADKYDSGNLNGIGIEGGILILLPEF